MDFSLPAYSPDLALDLARLLVRLRNASDAVPVLDLAEEGRPGIVNHYLSLAGPTIPGWMIIRWADAALVLVDGTTQAQQALSMLAILNEPIDYSQLSGVNRYYRQVAELIFARMADIGVYSGMRLVCAGHSLGGPICYCVSRIAESLPWRTNNYAITFGAPRPGPETFARSVQVMSMVRWMNAGDPVPQVPPRQNQAPLFFTTLSQTGRLNANRYVHPHGGILLETNGSVEDVIEENVASINLTLSLGSWLVSLATDNPTAHNMNEYVTRLVTRIATLGPTRPADTGSPDRGHRVRDSSREIQRQVEETLAILNGQTREGNIGEVVIPAEQAFTAHRNGDVWQVYLTGTYFATGPTRRRARHLAALGNVFLRKLQTEGVVDTTALVGAFQTYLQEATDPTGRFHPTMRTNLEP